MFGIIENIERKYNDGERLTVRELATYAAYWFCKDCSFQNWNRDAAAQLAAIGMIPKHRIAAVDAEGQKIKKALL